MAEEILCSGFEYREVGGELQRRPVDRERLSPVDAAWLVLKRDSDFIPQEVTTHFAQAKDRVFIG